MTAPSFVASCKSAAPALSDHSTSKARGPAPKCADRGVEARRVVDKFRHRRQDLVPLHVLGPPRRRVQHRQVARVGEAQVHLDAVARRPRVAQVPRERPLRRFREHLERDGADAPPRLHVFILPRGPVDARHDLFHELELLFFHDLAERVLAVAQARLDEARRAAEVGELRRVRVGLAVQAALEAGVDERLRRRRGAGVAAVARRLDEALGRGPEPGLRGDGHERGRRARGVPGADLRGERQRAPDRVARRRRVVAQHLAPHGRRRPGGFHAAPRAPREAGDDLQVRLVRQQRVDDGPRAGERRVDAREQRRRRGPRGRGVAVRRRRVLPPVAPQRERGAQPAGRRRGRGRRPRGVAQRRPAALAVAVRRPLQRRRGGRRRRGQLLVRVDAVVVVERGPHPSQRFDAIRRRRQRLDRGRERAGRQHPRTRRHEREQAAEAHQAHACPVCAIAASFSATLPMLALLPALASPKACRQSGLAQASKSAMVVPVTRVLGVHTLGMDA